MTKAHNLIGQVFDRLTVIERGVNTKAGKATWICHCICDINQEIRKEIIVTSGDLIQRKTKSCRCLNNEQIYTSTKTHGMYYSEEYNSWSGMLSRCTNPNASYYESYGGRGIIVCERWYQFENFYEDMGPKPVIDNLRFSLDRKNVDGNYEKDNCRWATEKEQANNRRIHRYLTLDGVTRTVSEWADILKIESKVLYRKIYKGLSDEEVLQF